MAVEESFPSGVLDCLTNFNDALTEVENALEPILKVPRSEQLDQLQPLDQAKVDLVAVYGVNALFWMYLCARGEDPKEHAVKQELARVQSQMARVKEVADKQQQPKLDKGATRRFIRSALWHQAHAKAAIDTDQTGEAGAELYGSPAAKKTKQDIVPEASTPANAGPPPPSAGKSKKKTKQRGKN